MDVEFIKRAAEKTGFVREKYVDGKVPTLPANIVAIPFFGDTKHEFVLATLLLHRLKEARPEKYFIVCGQPGQSGLFHSADEYWGIKDDGAAKTILNAGVGFENTNEKATFYEKQLNRFVETVSSVDLTELYDNGLTKKFFDKFKTVTYSLHSQPTVKQDFAKVLSAKHGFKVYIRPNKAARSWHRGKVESVSIKPDFWQSLIDRLVLVGITPVVQLDGGTWPVDTSRCLLAPTKLLDQMATMRAVGCVVDVFSGLSRLSLAARTPFLTVSERELHFQTKDYEIDDLCGVGIPFQYIFSFATMIENGDYVSVVDIILTKLKSFLSTIDQNSLPGTAETTVVAPYSLVRERRVKQFGMNFFKIPKI